MKATEILEKGRSIIGQRGTEYETTTGGGERSFNAISTAFNAITGKSITAAEVALMLQVVKDVRQWSQDRLHEDSVIDGVNYAALKGEELYKQYSTSEVNINQFVTQVTVGKAFFAGLPEDDLK